MGVGKCLKETGVPYCDVCYAGVKKRIKKKFRPKAKKKNSFSSFCFFSLNRPPATQFYGRGEWAV